MNKIFSVLGCSEWCVGLHKSRLFGERLLVKLEPLYASYNEMLIERTNFLDMMYLSECAMFMYIVCAILMNVYWYHMYVPYVCMHGV